MEVTAPRVLIAAVPGAAARLCRILAAHPKLVVRTVSQAQAALAAEQFALAVLGVYFDESRMFDVMSFARASVLNRGVPIVCVLGMRGGLSPGTLRMVAQTVNGLAQSEFLDLAAIEDDRIGNALVLKRLERYLVPPAAAAPAAPRHEAR